MTAEIAILNKSAVALAADSAVTVGRNRKVYNSANKLFMLSKHEPLGAMIYGSAEFLGIPWETIIKLYRQSIADISFGSVEECSNHFLEFLCGDNAPFTEADRENSVVSIVGLGFSQMQSDLADLIEGLESSLKEKSNSGDREALITEEAENLLGNYEKAINDYPDLEEPFEPYDDAQLVIIRTACEKAIEYVFEDFLWSSECKERLICPGSELVV